MFSWEKMRDLLRGLDGSKARSMMISNLCVGLTQMRLCTVQEIRELKVSILEAEFSSDLTLSMSL